MKVEDLLKERETLLQQRESLIANLNAVSGAIQLCEKLIASMGNEAMPAAEGEAKKPDMKFVK